MAGIVKRLPFALSGRTTSASSTYALADVAYDYAIGGMPFLSAVNDDRPLTRAGAPVRKDQIDQQQIPGEQSLASWWLRSQSSWVGGAGLLYQDPSVDNQYAIRFAESVGVNPWVNGKLTLLRSTSQRIADAAATAQHVMGWNDGTNRFWHAAGTALKSDDGTTTTAITWGGTGTILSLTSDGTNYYAADSTAIYAGAGSSAGTLSWNTGSSNVAIGWAKGRLMAGIANKVYELNVMGPALPAAKFTHLNSAWKWTAFAEGTTAIYASGYAGSQSSIYKFVLDTSGNVPTLASGGVQTAQLPLGEIVHSMTVYLGSFVGIGTSRGFRVGQINDQGDIEYGPLLIENSAGCKAVAAYDRFFYVAATNAIDGASGLYRVDLGQPNQTDGPGPSIRFAYATDLQAHVTGEVSSVSVFGTSSRMVLAVVGQGAYLESASQLEPTGYLKTGRVRFNTLEPKIFKFVTVRTPGTLMGSVAVSAIDPGGADTSILTISQAATTAIENVLLSAPPGAVEWLQLKITLGRSGTDTTKGGEVNGWQLKAMPGAVRQRIFTLPLLCFDKEKDRTGQTVGREGRSQARLEAFEQLFQRGDAVSFQDLANDISYLVVIDDYEYRQTASPGPNRQNFGGVIWAKLRTIADVITV